MQKLAVALALVLLALSSFAQSPTATRDVLISNLSLAGISQLSPADQLTIVTEIKSLCCRQNRTQEIKERILDAFQRRGYFKATVEKLEVTPVNEASLPQKVNVSASIDEGRQYRLKDVIFSDAKAFPNDQLRSQFPIADGDIFNVEKIRAGLDDLRKLYVSQGYLSFVPVPNTDVDDATTSVSLRIDLDEGTQFRFGFLILDGVEPQAGMGAKLTAAWKPYVGKVYDPKLVDQYWHEIAKLLPPGLDRQTALGTREDQQSGRVFPTIELPEPK